MVLEFHNHRNSQKIKEPVAYVLYNASQKLGRKNKIKYSLDLKPPVCRGSSNNQNWQVFDSDFFEKTGMDYSPILKYLNIQCIFFGLLFGGSFQKMECPRKAILVGGFFFPPQNTSHFFIFCMVPNGFFHDTC